MRKLAILNFVLLIVSYCFCYFCHQKNDKMNSYQNGYIRGVMDMQDLIVKKGFGYIRNGDFVWAEEKRK